MDQEMEEPNLLLEADRGRQAQDLLEHPLLQEALQTLRSEFKEAWANSPARDSEGREKLWQLHALVGKFESHLTQVLQTGQLARLQLEEQSRLERMTEKMSGVLSRFTS